MNNKGIMLIGVIIIIVALSIVALGIVVFLGENLRLDTARINQARAFYAAQAGVMKAIVTYRNSGSLSAETNTQLFGNTYYSIGGSGMFFIANCSNPTIIASRKIKNISMTNVSSTQSLTITHMQVSWAPDGGETLTSIDLGRGTTEWTGTATSGTNIDMTDYTIGPGVTENDVWLDLIFKYRLSVQNSMPAQVKSRPDCWYGKECYTQGHNSHHAQKYNHACPNKKKSK